MYGARDGLPGYPVEQEPGIYVKPYPNLLLRNVHVFSRERMTCRTASNVGVAGVFLA